MDHFVTDNHTDTTIVFGIASYSIIRALEKASPLLIDITDLFVELISLTDDSVNISVDMFI
ncbi:MAG: hypothetical protein II294_02710, partial [Muribaculaceae bacterium]|nr:hypothetical protein [Muribaculaceae bacterium]